MNNSDFLTGEVLLAPGLRMAGLVQQPQAAWVTVVLLVGQRWGERRGGGFKQIIPEIDSNGEG